MRPKVYTTLGGHLLPHYPPFVICQLHFYQKRKRNAFLASKETMFHVPQYYMHYYFHSYLLLLKLSYRSQMPDKKCR